MECRGARIKGKSYSEIYGTSNPGCGWKGNRSGISQIEKNLTPFFEENGFECQKKFSLKGTYIASSFNISYYDCDFVHKEHKIIVELDGVYHKGRESQDLTRDLYLSGIGYNIIRIDTTLYNEDYIVKEILNLLKT